METIQHVDRLKALVACAKTPTSAKQMTGDRQKVGQMSYHLNRLAAIGFLKHDRREQRRGATETFWTTTLKGDQFLVRLGIGVDRSDAGA